MSRSIYGGRTEEADRERAFQRAAAAVSNGMADGGDVLDVLESLRAEAQHGRAYMEWITDVLTDMDAKVCAKKRHPAPRSPRSAVRTLTPLSADASPGLVPVPPPSRRSSSARRRVTFRLKELA